jgi:3-hydroxybutyryl-CoA dehydrogenase
LKRAEVPYLEDPQAHWQGLRIGELDLMMTDGRSATQVAAQTGNRSLGVIDLPLSFSSGSSLAISFATTVSQKDRDMAALVMKKYGIHLMEIADTPGLIVGRTIAMLINEAADAVQQGVSDKASIDTAMQLGTSYPMGPFAWLEMIGIQAVVVLLNHLFEAYRSDRYRISILLQKDYYTDQLSNLKNF